LVWYFLLMLYWRFETTWTNTLTGCFFFSGYSHTFNENTPCIISWSIYCHYHKSIQRYLWSLSHAFLFYFFAFMKRDIKILLLFCYQKKNVLFFSIVMISLWRIFNFFYFVSWNVIYHEENVSNSKFLFWYYIVYKYKKNFNIKPFIQIIY
jgi:hypothetical protein